MKNRLLRHCRRQKHVAANKGTFSYHCCTPQRTTAVDTFFRSRARTSDVLLKTEYFVAWPRWQNVPSHETVIPVGGAKRQKYKEAKALVTSGLWGGDTYDNPQPRWCEYRGNLSTRSLQKHSFCWALVALACWLRSNRATNERRSTGG